MYHYYMFNKPYGCVCARRDDKHPTVMDYFKELNNPNLSPVGRLDRETEGLLLVTDDGKFNQLMTNPANKIEKTYEFIVMGDISVSDKEKLEKGLYLTGSEKITAPATLNISDKKVLADIFNDLHPEIQESIKNNPKDTPVTLGTISVTEGRKHQVRRMMRAVGCYVVKLKRISMGEYVINNSLLPENYTILNVYCSLNGH